MEEFCRSQRETLAELHRVAPGAPFLALGQTVFWDEPIKAGVIQASRREGFERRFVSGVHDTDYFAKLSQKERKNGYVALPHNDTGTQALWSAAGEFSALFGSETVVTRDRLASLGGKVALVAEQRPGYLDAITEAWGWRGVVSLGRKMRTTAETSLDRVFPTLVETFDWAIQTSSALVTGCDQERTEEATAQLKSIVCDAAEGLEGQFLADYYARVSPQIYDLVAHEPLGVEVARTTGLLKFNTATCDSPRFSLLDLFLRPETRARACEAYDGAVSTAQMYVLSKFGVGAIPFDVYVPGKGRGTLRLGTRGGVIMTEEPLAFSFKKPVDSVQRLAEVLEAKFGPDVVVVGKAVTMLGMLGREFVFVFHEGASGYAGITREFHRSLKEFWDIGLLNPILRVKYSPWDALAKCKLWLRLPEDLRRPFGTDELSAESFSRRWGAVVEEQNAVLHRLATLERPLALIEYLDKHLGGQWKVLAQEYNELHARLAALNKKVGDVRSRRAKAVKEFRSLRSKRVRAEEALGRHWRDKVFQKTATERDMEHRRKLQEALDQVLRETEESKARWRTLFDEQEQIVSALEVVTALERRKSIAFEAELTRMRLIREAVIATEGLKKAGHRPSAWWFHLLSPSGCWYKETMRRALYYLEPMA